MRRSRILSLLVCLSVTVSLVVAMPAPTVRAGTSPWRWQNPMPNGEQLISVCMAPGAGSSVVWSVGDYGTVLKSADNGATWSAIVSGTTESLLGVDVIDDNTGWMVGTFGTIVRLSGGTCATQTSPTGQHLSDVDAIDATHAWAVGASGEIIRTVNGTDWTTVTSPTTEYLTAVQFLSANEGWVAGYNNALYYTPDGGVTWRFKGTADVDFHIYDFRVDGDTVWAVGRDSAYTPLVYKATDGRIHANDTDVPFYATVPGTGLSDYPSSIGYLDATHLWLTSVYGEVVFYNGTTWSAQVSPYGSTWLNDIDFRNASTGVLVGSGGAIGRTTTGGSTWTARASYTNGPVFGIDFVSLTTGYTVYGYDMLKTTDGGQSWSVMSTGQDRGLLNVDFLDATHGAAVGQTGTILLNSGGAAWTPVSGPSPSIEFRGVCYQSPTRVWACGGSGNIGWWDGSSWHGVADSKAGTDLLYDIDFFDADHGIAVGVNGTVVYTTDGGITWAPGVSGEIAGDGIFAVDMVSSTVGFMVGDDQADSSNNGMIMKKTTDGGATWTPMTPPVSESYKPLEDVSFADANNGWIVGGMGSWYHTTNGGDTWTNEVGNGAWPVSVCAFSPTAAWAGTNYGGILTTTAAPVALSPVYRFYNFTNNTHFFTPSAEEADHVIATWPNVYRYEGICYYTNPANNTQPLYRFYNRNSASHFYTASAEEAAHILATWPTIFSLDGQTYAVNPAPVVNSVPVYRFYNLRNGSHFYTASAEEADMVIATWPSVYRYEGPAFWIGQ